MRRRKFKQIAASIVALTMVGTSLPADIGYCGIPASCL